MSNKVIELYSKDFSGKKIIKNIPNKRGIIMYKAEWCGHCKRTFPEFTKSANLLGQLFTFYVVDSDKNPDVIANHNVKGYPTIRYVDNNGNIYKDYSNGRTVKDFLDSICIEASVCKKFSF